MGVTEQTRLVAIYVKILVIIAIKLHFNQAKEECSNHSFAFRISSIVNSWPLFCQLSETLAPAFLNKPKSLSASCLETIGSYSPEDMKICFLVRSGNVCGTSGTIARKRIAEESISGRSNSILACYVCTIRISYSYYMLQIKIISFRCIIYKIC